MNQLEDWEVNTLIDLIPYADRNQWEMCRQQIYITAQVNSKKKLKAKDIMEFAWEKPVNVKHETPTNEEISKARNMAKSFEEMIINDKVKEVEVVGFFNNKNNIELK
jgi:hypothetical protein